MIEYSSWSSLRPGQNSRLRKRSPFLKDASVYDKVNGVDKLILEKYLHAVNHAFATERLDASSPLVADFVERLVVSNWTLPHHS